MVSFGSSGIRGPYGSVATVDLALALGRAIGADARRVLVGRDARISGPALEAAAVAGLLAAGCEVELAGVAPTPAIARAGRAFDASLVVTASHNPAPDNGFKVWNPDGKAFDGRQRRRIEEALAKPAAPGAAWSALATPTRHPRVVPDHIEAIRALVGDLARPLKIVVDAGNGAGCVEAPMLLSAMGARVVTLNAQPDGAFPGRPSEPSPENLKDLSETVRRTGADLGIAHDGDADRCVAVREDGVVVPGDELAILFARASGARRVVVPVDMSMALDDALPGVEVVRCRVGDAYVSETIVEKGAQWGGEASGAWIFPEMSLCPDGPLAAAHVAALVAREGALSPLLSDLPRYPIERGSVRVRPDALAAAVDAAAARLAKAGEVSTIDGVRVDLGDGWILVRASGTEPKIRVTAEARTPETARRYVTLGLDAVADFRVSG